MKVPGAQLGDGGLERGRTELRGVVAHDPLQPPAGSGQVGGNPLGRWLVHCAEGLRLVTSSVAQTYAEATSMAVSCHTVPLVPERRPMQKQSSCTSSPG
jgi:hypothetical protein